MLDIPSPTCLFDSLCKIENWEPVPDNNVKRETFAATRHPDFITPDLWPPNSPDLNPVDYRIWAVLQERFCRKSVKNWILMNWNGFWLKCGLASSSVADQAIDQWRVALTHVLKVKRKAFWIHAMMCCSTTVSNLLWNLHSLFFFFFCFFHNF